MNTFDPRIPDVPKDVSETIRKELGQDTIQFSRPVDGTTGRTFFVTSHSGKHVLRIEENPGTHLTRAIAAIQLAANAKVAVPSIRAICNQGSESFFWYLEDYVSGTAFPHTGYDDKAIQSATIDLGLNLRRLHSIPCAKFGLLAPNPWLNWDTAAERYKNAAEKVERALKFAQVSTAWLDQVQSAHEYVIALPYSKACLCKGDCRSTNILTDGGRISAIIDWEWATGDLGVSDIAAWHFANQDSRALDLILSAYQPANEAEFRRQIAALIVIGIVSEFLVFEEHSNFFTQGDMSTGLNERRSKLLDCLKKPLWLQ